MPTDAETYLRHLGERQVLAGDRERRYGPDGGPMAQAARALLTAGAVPAEVAEQIVQDYEWALALRDPDRMPRLQIRRRATAGTAPGPGNPVSDVPGSAVQPLGVPRVAVCHRTVDQPWGTVTLTSVALEPALATASATAGSGTASARIGRGTASARVGAVIRWPAGTGGRRHRRRRLASPAARPRPRQVTITDDRGASVLAGFSGGGGEDEWTGEFRAQPNSPQGSLSADTAFVEILGERIDLPSIPGAAVRLERVDSGSPAAAALWDAVSGPFAGHGFSDPEIAIDAFLACGVLAPDDPVIDQVRAVATALGHPHPAARWSPGGPGPAPPTAPAAPTALPEPWAALVARQTRHAPPAPGPTGVLPVAAATPVFDDASIAVSVLTSEPDEFRIAITMVGGRWPPDDWDPDASTVNWWARDDRGGVYLGEWRGSRGDRHRVAGEIGFDIPLDPAATRLDLLPTGPTTRAVIEVPLTWSTTDGSGS